ncbi:carboxypeptidase-like regulatory domain-containing protein [Pedobacter sp. HDW13]|uniref:carboxypeptidase-like regulatory domain-containing protein n=1 Tax=Pedobacter sp. HDW13 TaxID=2714940 RepID=UPI001408E980|nr:carboxypeptidase-like regulatory domain-containing protein [Pedobacter sp. HDW13]QIL41306.1 carboxypeptidase-like regulatory domain-containing protein [Pedobacter sp. HDW13]
MKLLRLSLLFIITLTTQSLFAQVIYRGTITDDKKRILPLVTVKLIIENIETASNQKGQFNITSSGGLSDTLVFSSVGYESKKIATIDFKQNSKIILPENILSLNQVNITGGRKKNVIINYFEYAQASYNPRIRKKISPYISPFPIAKLFTSEIANAKLEKITLGRFIYKDYLTVSPSNTFAHIMQNRRYSPIEVDQQQIATARSNFGNEKIITKSYNVRFNLYLLEADTLTGKPGKLLYKDKIEVKLTNSATLIEVGLATKQIFIPHQKFYVMVEWLYIPFNENIALSHELVNKPAQLNKNQDRTTIMPVYKTNYEPLLSIYAAKKDKVATKWRLIGDQWESLPLAKNNQHEMELALSATVSYFEK